MREADETSGCLFIHIDVEGQVWGRYSLRNTRQVVNEARASLDAVFGAHDAAFVRPSIPPERLIWAGLIRVLFLVRSERQVMEQTHYSRLFRWLLGADMDDPLWFPTVINKNCDQLLIT